MDGGRERANEPEHKQHHENQAKNAAKSGAAVAAMCVITAPAAENNDEKDNDEDRAHCLGSRSDVLRDARLFNAERRKIVPCPGRALRVASRWKFARG